MRFRYHERRKPAKQPGGKGQAYPMMTVIFFLLTVCLLAASYATMHPLYTQDSAAVEITEEEALRRLDQQGEGGGHTVLCSYYYSQEDREWERNMQMVAAIASLAMGLSFFSQILHRKPPPALRQRKRFGRPPNACDRDS